LAKYLEYTTFRYWHDVRIQSLYLGQYMRNIPYWFNIAPIRLCYWIYSIFNKSIHGNCYKLNTVNSSLIICDFTFTSHIPVIMGQVFYGTDQWPTWPIHSVGASLYEARELQQLALNFLATFFSGYLTYRTTTVIHLHGPRKFLPYV